jgi:hypothetical protein
MSTTAEATPSDKVCIPDELSLPDGPFTALRYHFGMLLGVDDFETEQRYHRGKMRLHNAWLHGPGIVWGLGVDTNGNELRVAPGLALDPTGRELHLDVQCCMDVGAWYDANEDTAQLPVDDTTDAPKPFDGRIELVFCSCGTRPVPAISAPCDGAAVDTAYARTFETVSIRFIPEVAPPETPRYPRLRMLFGIDDGAAAELTDAERQAISDARAEVLASGTWSQTLLASFREFANADVSELEPAKPADGSATPYPGLDDEGVVLANVTGITLSGSTGSWTLESATVDLTPRRVHVATRTIEELLCGDLRDGTAAGPQVGDWEFDGNQKVTLGFTAAVDPATLHASSFAASELDPANGWQAIAITQAPNVPDDTHVEVTLDSKPAFAIWRFVAFGTGSSPILGADHVPLAGAVGGPPGTAADGHDYVHLTTT